MLLNITEPAGVMAAANLFVVLHVAAAWQVRRRLLLLGCPSARPLAVPADHTLRPACWLAGAQPGSVHVTPQSTHALAPPQTARAQVFAMPIFDAAETAIRRRMASPPRPLTLRLLFRSAYVAAVTFVACLLPFFGELM